MYVHCKSIYFCEWPIQTYAERNCVKINCQIHQILPFYFMMEEKILQIYQCEIIYHSQNKELNSCKIDWVYRIHLCEHYQAENMPGLLFFHFMVRNKQMPGNKFLEKLTGTKSARPSKTWVKPCLNSLEKKQSDSVSFACGSETESWHTLFFTSPEWFCGQTPSRGCILPHNLFCNITAWIQSKIWIS